MLNVGGFGWVNHQRRRCRIGPARLARVAIVCLVCAVGTLHVASASPTRPSCRFHDSATDPGAREPGQESAIERSTPMMKTVSLMTPRIENLSAGSRARVLFGSK